jgi:hypothetical protein
VCVCVCVYVCVCKTVPVTPVQDVVALANVCIFERE